MLRGLLVRNPPTSTKSHRNAGWCVSSVTTFANRCSFNASLSLSFRISCRSDQTYLTRCETATPTAVQPSANITSTVAKPTTRSLLTACLGNPTPDSCPPRLADMPSPTQRFRRRRPYMISNCAISRFILMLLSPHLSREMSQSRGGRGSVVTFW